MKQYLTILLICLGCHAMAQGSSSAVHVTVIKGDNNGDNAIIVYNPRQLLKISDFQGPADQSTNLLAMTHSGIGMKYEWHENADGATLKVIITPTFNRSRSWFKPEGKNAYVLAHEQKHFDITGLKCCELVTAISNYPFTREHYKEELEALFNKAQKEMHDEQEKYDTETNHSVIKAEQARWSNDLDARIKQQTCY